ncbi:hypothetical protein P8452_15285 [Trifolium repens]|nr:hypothetical protein QL285_055211 [Trifolium repens]WJX26354.1 hypothetical protein P8452_15285 [Trifolium repens]
MGLSKLNLFSVMIVAALLLSTTPTMAQSPASSPTKSQPPRKAISPSPASSPPQPSDAAVPAFSPSSISAPPSEAPGPASNGVVFNRVSVAAGSAALVMFVAAFII